ncbi:MAG: OB-fold nucleic acid binding domain-containing protein, partial [Acidimicrobiales bacterium]
MTGRRLRTLAATGASELKSVPPRKAASLRTLGIESVLDLLTHYPRRYVDRRNAVLIADLEDGEEAMVTGRVLASSSRRLRSHKVMTEVVVSDSTGELSCVFFNQAWRKLQLVPGKEVTVFGRMELYRSTRQMSHPVVDLVGNQTGRLVAIYPQSQKARITSVELGTYVAEALERAGEFAEPVPVALLRRERLIGRTEAFGSIHLPGEHSAHVLARRRLVFDELLRLQVLLVSKKRALALEAR